MRKQVIDIFSEWMEAYVRRQSEDGGSEADCRAWIESNCPEATEEVQQAVVDCFNRKPEAVCSWEFTEKRELNIIIKNNKFNNRDNE